MSQVTIITVVSTDHFQWYIPLFLYTAIKAYPEYSIKIYVRGTLSDKNKKLISTIKGDYKIYEDSFLTFPDAPSMCNSLRFVVRKDIQTKYFYVTDIDFLIFRHGLTHDKYYIDMIRSTGQPYAAWRSAIKYPKRPDVTQWWEGKWTRIAAGTSFFKTKDWFKKTKAVIKYYEHALVTQGTDVYDFTPAASYREYDEVMLYRICKLSNLKTPKIKDCFVNGAKFDILYRDIHLGDFKFNERWKSRKKMESRLHIKNVINFKKLEKDSQWGKICSTVCENCKEVNKTIKHLREYCGI